VLLRFPLRPKTELTVKNRSSDDSEVKSAERRLNRKARLDIGRSENNLPIMVKNGYPGG